MKASENTAPEDITAENTESQQAHNYSYGAIYDQGTGWYAVVHQYDCARSTDGSLRFFTYSWSSNNPVGTSEDHPTVAIRHAKMFCLKKPVVGQDYPGWTFCGTVKRLASELLKQS
ncbi:unnamed protein product [Sphagnum jensenii]